MMSELARSFFSDNPAIAGPLIAIVVFTLVFVSAVVRVLRANREHVDRMARLPLEGDGMEVEHG